MLTAGQHKAAKQCNKNPHSHVDLLRSFIVLLYIAFQIMSRSSAISKIKLTFCRIIKSAAPIEAQLYI